MADRIIGACALSTLIAIAACSGEAAPPAADLAEVPPPANAGGGTEQTPPPPDVGFEFDAGSPPKPPKERTIWGIDDANMLVTFPAKTPSMVTAGAVSGLASGERIVGIDFRPADGKLYALGSSSRVYTIDITTRAASAVAASPFTPALAGQSFGFDFNPVADAIRVHSDFDQNLRLSPMTGAALGTDKPLAFAMGDPNQGQSPNVVAAAYTNSVAPKPAATVLYGLDSTRNLLVKVAPPNDGIVTTIGDLTVDASAVAGFDIWGDAALEAYAALVVDGATGLYTIDLATGKATSKGPITVTSPLVGIAVEP